MRDNDVAKIDIYVLSNRAAVASHEGMMALGNHEPRSTKIMLKKLSCAAGVDHDATDFPGRHGRPSIISGFDDRPLAAVWPSALSRHAREKFMLIIMAGMPASWHVRAITPAER